MTYSDLPNASIDRAPINKMRMKDKLNQGNREGQQKEPTPMMQQYVGIDL
jgi:hypothetical protein